VCTALPAQSFLSYASESDPATLPPYGSGTLAPGIRPRMVSNINGLSMHVLEAGFDEADRPLVVLLHGFPDLCYCCRKIMVPLAAAGDRIGNDRKARCLADFSLKVTIDVHDLTGPQIPCLHIKRVQKENPPAAEDAPRSRKIVTNSFC
jgi:hypothetical protein